jgi:hypothetical protein
MAKAIILIIGLILIISAFQVSAFSFQDITDKWAMFKFNVKSFTEDAKAGFIRDNDNYVDARLKYAESRVKDIQEKVSSDLFDKLQDNYNINIQAAYNHLSASRYDEFAQALEIHKRYLLEVNATKSVRYIDFINGEAESTKEGYHRQDSVIRQDILEDGGEYA